MKKKNSLIFQTETLKSEFEEEKTENKGFLFFFKICIVRKELMGTTEDVIKKNVFPKPIRRCLVYHHFCSPHNNLSYLLKKTLLNTYAERLIDQAFLMRNSVILFPSIIWQDLNPKPSNDKVSINMTKSILVSLV